MFFAKGDPLKLRFDNFALDDSIPELTQGGAAVAIEPKVFDVLSYLITHRDRIVSKDELIEHVWAGRIVSDAAVTSRINLVRQAVGDSGRDQRVIQTVPKRGFRFVAQVDPEEAARSEEPLASQSTGYASKNQVLVIVMPFRDLSENGSGLLAQGLTEDLTVALSRYSDVSVLSPQSARKIEENASMLETPMASIPADFLVTGTLRIINQNVRVTVQLLDRSSGATVFSEKYDRRADDIFKLQDEVVQALAGCLPWRALDALGRKFAVHQPPNPTAYQRFLKVQSELDHQSDLRKYVSDLRSILARDPNYGFVHAELAFFLAYMVFFTGQQSEQDINDAMKHARLALKIAPQNERVLSKSAMVFQFAGQFSIAMKLGEQAMRLNPNSTDCTHYFATILGASGRAEEALELHRLTQSLDPFFPEYHYEGMVETLFLLGRYAEALEIVDKWRDPARHIHAYAGALAAMAGNEDRAKASIGTFEETAPDGYSNATFVSAIMRYHRRPQDKNKWLHAFRAARLSGLDNVQDENLRSS